MANDLKEREENAAGNADDFYNPGQQAYDEQFNGIAQAENDNEFNDIIAANYGDEKPPAEKVDSHGDSVQRNYNADNPNKNIDKAKDAEEAGGGQDFVKGGASPVKGGGLSGMFKGLGNKKKMGPTSGIIGLMLFGLVGVGGGTSMLASSLLVNIVEILHNDRADGSRANELFSQSMLSNEFKNGGGAIGCGKIAIQCRMGSASGTEIENYEKIGFKIEGSVVDGEGNVVDSYSTEKNGVNEPGATDRNYAKGLLGADGKPAYQLKIDSITFPDGKIVTSGDGFFKYTAANVKMRVAYLKAFNPISAFFLNNRFASVLKDTFGIEKGNVLKGTTEAEIDKSFNEQTGGASEEDNKNGVAEKKPSQLEEAEKTAGEKIKDAGGKALGAATVAGQAACKAYNITRYAVDIVKINRMYALVKFMYPFFRVASQIKSQGQVSPVEVSDLSGKLTYYESNKDLTASQNYDGTDYPAGSANPKYGLSATDSQGYKIAAYGDRSKLADFAKQWLLGGKKGGAVDQAESWIHKIQAGAVGVTLGLTGRGQKGGKTIVRNVCKTLSSKAGLAIAIVGGLSALGDCVTSFIGNEATGPAGCGALVSAFAWFLGGYIAVSAVEASLSSISKAAEDEAKDLNLGSDLKGVDAGNALAAGAGLMLGDAATSSGLAPASSTAQVQGYIAATDDLNNQYIAAAQYSARDTPFDIYNKYSFLGSISYKLQLADGTHAPVFASLSNLASILTTAFFNKSVTASAYSSQPSYDQTERYDCPDPDLADNNMIGDKLCNVATYMPASDLEKAQAQINGGNTINTMLTYMTSDQDKSEADGGTLDDSFGGDGSSSSLLDLKPELDPKSAKASTDLNGKPNPGSQYAMYLEYCTDARNTPNNQTTWDGEKGAQSYWGTTDKEVEVGSNRDQDWYTGKQCTNDSTMMQMFREYTNYCQQKATAAHASNCWDITSTTTPPATGCGGSLDGDSKALAQKILSCPNIQFQDGKGPEYQAMQHIAQTGHATECNAVAISPTILKYILTGAAQYKITVGVLTDGHGCDGGEHQNGDAVDINGITPADKDFEHSITWSLDDQINISAFEKYMDSQASKGALRFGQTQCFEGAHGAPQPQLTNATVFNDTCNHLHMDAGGH